MIFDSLYELCMLWLVYLDMFIKIDILVLQSYISYIVCKYEEVFCPNFSTRHICKSWRVVLALVNNLVWCFSMSIFIKTDFNLQNELS